MSPRPGEKKAGNGMRLLGLSFPSEGPFFLYKTFLHVPGVFLPLAFLLDISPLLVTAGVSLGAPLPKNEDRHCGHNYSREKPCANAQDRPCSVFRRIRSDPNR